MCTFLPTTAMTQESSCLRKGTPLASRGAQGVSGPLLSCVWNLRVFPEMHDGDCPFVLCLHPLGCLRRGVRASGSFQERAGKSGSFGMWDHPRVNILGFAIINSNRSDGILISVFRQNNFMSASRHHIIDIRRFLFQKFSVNFYISSIGF